MSEATDAVSGVDGVEGGRDPDVSREVEASSAEKHLRRADASHANGRLGATLGSEISSTPNSQFGTREFGGRIGS